MMNLLLSADSELGLIFFVGILLLTTFIVMIVKFFEMASDLKNISKDLSSILFIIKGEKDNGSGQSDK